MRAEITDRLIGLLKPGDKPYEVRDVKTMGFLVRVQPSGAMSYICQYRRSKRKTIDRVGGGTTLVQARTAAMAILTAELNGGYDPAKKTKGGLSV